MYDTLSDDQSFCYKDQLAQVHALHNMLQNTYSQFSRQRIILQLLSLLLIWLLM